MDPARQIEELDAVLSALSHPARRQILLTIWFRGGEMGSGDIADRFAHSWPTTTRHLRVLEEAELVTQEKQGRTRVYRVNHQKLAAVREWLAWFDKPP
ncbi:MAG TPA: metalloregulator ArsR/SmtB family transcription factor [Thermoanaerobaculia bacterium]